MNELLPLVSTGFSGFSLAGVVLILYRLTELEKDVRIIRDKSDQTSNKVIRLEALKEKERR